MLFPDRLKRAFYALFKASVPRLDYYAPYSAKVIKQSGPNLLDVVPDDARIPSMGGVPIRHGQPGNTINVADGSTVIVSWENGDPSRPFVALWQGGETATKITISASNITLGSETGAQPAVLGQTLQSYLNSLANALISHTHPVAGAVAGASVPLAVPGVITPPTITATKVNVA